MNQKRAGKTIQGTTVRRHAALRVLILMLACSLAGADSDVASGAPSAFALSFDEHSLSVKSEDARLGEVLGELARQAGFKVQISETAAKKRLQIAYDNVPLDRGIRGILQGESYVVIWADAAPSPDTPAQRKVAAIRVLSNGEEAHRHTRSKPTTRGPPGRHVTNQWPDAIQGLVRRVSNAESPAARADALKALGKREEVDGLRSVFINAIKDPAPEVRKTALVNMDEWKGKPPFELVAELALNDESPTLRKYAFQVMTYEYAEEAADYLRKGLQDPDPGVRAYAGERLDELEGVSEEFEVEAEIENPGEFE